MVEIYTDGSFNKKMVPRKCGYAAVIPNINYHGFVSTMAIYGFETSKEYIDMWNVGGEILGVLKGIDLALCIQDDKDLHIYHDYEGLAKWANYEWKVKKKITTAYRDIINKYRDSGIKITFHKVKAHSKNKYNDIADFFAGKACKFETPGPRTESLDEIFVAKKESTEKE